MNSSMKAEEKDCIECKLTRDFEVLRHTSLFAGADNEVIKLFAYLAKRKKYQRGDHIVHAGREAEEAYLLISGKAKVTAVHRNTEVMLQHLAPQTFFGELALLARFKWFFTVEALEECEIVSITRESFKKVLEKYPEKRDRMIEKIVQIRVERLIAQTTYMLDVIDEATHSPMNNASLNVLI